MNQLSESGVRIGGEVVSDGQGRRRIEAISPIDGNAFGDVLQGTADDALRAFDVAKRSFGSWSTTPVDERVATLRAIAGALRDEASVTGESSWAWLLSTETGKRLAEAQGEINFSAVYFDAFADLLEAQRDEQFSVIPGITHRVQPQAMGVVAVITPWNFPVSIPARKIAAALVAGCTVVFRAAELAALSSLRLSALIERFVPAGVVNTVLGTPADVVTPWLERVDCVSFTGSTRVGRIINEQIAPRFTPAVMELGGNASFVVLDDADINAAVDTLMIAKFRNNGQSCIGANNVLIPRSLEADFRDALTAAASSLVVGDPRDAATDLGALAPAKDPARVNSLVDDAVAAGGEALLGQTELPTSGHYAAPQFVMNAPASSTLVADEVFGPAAGIIAYDDLNEALGLQRASGYGLASYVCTQDESRADAVAAEFRAGIIGINTATPNYPGAPFGGIGLSGLGYEGGRQGLEAHQHFRTIATKTESV
ncbi:aldehyde dehydrogenase family protein [Paramicrobacterium agarici]|uniref:aldehyde dehydrogenase family protein n=1 Tax=Paramicrobacterium agarici TaxID=630514 RepID=UPI0011525950|nr:aldehyde dehydrogenase family protein [Microbacterium agarici]TQO22898.1 succinate-semialdehyde dehydrogenase/glutarate-semialdehyde dehydrogenase [Microbacterium agarici]